MTCAVLCACGGDDPVPAGAGRPAGHRRMLEALRDVAARTADEHAYLGDRAARDLRAEVARLAGAAPWRTRLDLGIAELRAGHERPGIAVLEAAYGELRDGSLAGGPEAAGELGFYLGVAYLRLAETENCCAAPVAESCILPIRGGALHRKAEGSTRAMQCFLEVLEEAPPESARRYSAQWLLNVAAQTLGRYPDGVPERFRVPPSAFEPAVEFPRFTNIAARLGLDTFSHAGGAIVDDFDGDDDLDIVASNWDTAGQIRFFVNRGDGTFAERSAEAGLTGLLGGLNLVQADYDGDGDLDFLVLRGAWLFEHGRHPNSLVRNEGDGTFTDVTFDAGLGDAHYPTQTADWADYDLDGDLDLYVGNESSTQVRYPAQLFRNEGDGTFTDVADWAGVRNYGYAKSVGWGDYDGDRWPDLYVSNNGTPNRLFHNRGDGTFEDVAEAAGVTGPLASFPMWFWDFDNDGALDIYVSCYGTTIGHLTAYYAGMDVRWDTARLYRGDGRGGFTDVARECGLTYPAMPMGSNFGDLDNDGFLDFYLGTGNVYYHSVMPNLMFKNDRGRAFVDVTMPGGFGHLQKGHGIAFADLDHDGDQDVFAEMGGAYTGDAYHDALYENPGFGNHWLTVHLVGTESNRSAIGSRIRVEVDEGGARRSIYRHVNSGGSFGGNPLRQTIGLGRAERITVVEVFWPKTGATQRVEGVGLDLAIRIVEGRPGHAPIALRRVRLGGG